MPLGAWASQLRHTKSNAATDIAPVAAFFIRLVDAEYPARLLRCAISRAKFSPVNVFRACQDLGCLYLIDLHCWFDVLFHILHVFFDYFLNVTFPFSIIRPRGLLPAGRRRPERS